MSQLQQSEPGRPATAVILPFPCSNDPHIRLRLALAGLDRAVAEQRQEVARWRDGLLELRSAVAGIDVSLHTFKASLDAVAPAVADLEAQARQLKQSADGIG